MLVRGVEIGSLLEVLVGCGNALRESIGLGWNCDRAVVTVGSTGVHGTVPISRAPRECFAVFVLHGRRT